MGGIKEERRLIITRNIRAIQDTKNSWIIARSVKTLPDGALWVPELSPSRELLSDYLRLRKMGLWNEHAFKTIYVPTFLREMKGSKEAKQYLNLLFNLSKKGKTIEIACFCQDETMCHRSIIAGLLQGVGTQVTTDKNRDYSDYLRQYKETRREKDNV